MSGVKLHIGQLSANQRRSHAFSQNTNLLVAVIAAELNSVRFNPPVDEVYVSAFCMDQTGMTKRLWDEVRLWAGAAGCDLGMLQGGKAPNHALTSST